MTDAQVPIANHVIASEHSKEKRQRRRKVNAILETGRKVRQVFLYGQVKVHTLIMLCYACSDGCLFVFEPVCRLPCRTWVNF